MKPMTRRFILVFGASVLVAVWVAAHRNPGLSINRETAGGIEVGMSEADVEILLGLPAGDYSTGAVGLDVERDDSSKVAFLSLIRIGYQARTGEHVKEWLGDRGYVAVWFDKDGKVEESRVEVLVRVRSYDASIWTKVRRWLRL